MIRVIQILALLIFSSVACQEAGEVDTSSSSPKAIQPTVTARPTSFPFPLNFFVPQMQKSGNVMVELLPAADYSDVYLLITREQEQYRFSVSAMQNRLDVDPHVWFTSVKIMALSDLDLDGEPEIVLDISPQANRPYSSVMLVFWDAKSQAYYLKDVGGARAGNAPRTVDIEGDNRLEFVAVNVLFNAELGGVVPDESFSPLQILRFEEGQIIDVTHEYPELVQEDANLWLAAVQNRTIALSDDYLSVRPASPEFLVTLDTYYDFLFLAAYLADMYVLGKEQEGWNIVQEMCQSDHCQLRLFEFGTLERALTVQGYIKQGHGTSLPMKINAEIVK